MLTVALGYYVAQHATVDSDINKLINPKLPWRQQEAALDRAFPQNADLLAIVIDAKNPDQAEDAAEALATALRSEKNPLPYGTAARWRQRQSLSSATGSLFLPLRGPKTSRIRSSRRSR